MFPGAHTADQASSPGRFFSFTMDGEKTMHASLSRIWIICLQLQIVVVLLQKLSVTSSVLRLTWSTMAFQAAVSYAIDS